MTGRHCLAKRNLFVVALQSLTSSHIQSRSTIHSCPDRIESNRITSNRRHASYPIAHFSDGLHSVRPGGP
jgi:hypothetical protein